MDIAVFSKMTGIYLSHKWGNRYRETVQTTFAPHKDIIIIPIPSEFTTEKRLNLLKNTGRR